MTEICYNSEQLLLKQTEENMSIIENPQPIEIDLRGTSAIARYDVPVGSGDIMIVPDNSFQEIQQTRARVGRLAYEDEDFRHAMVPTVPLKTLSPARALGRQLAESISQYAPDKLAYLETAESPLHIEASEVAKPEVVESMPKRAWQRIRTAFRKDSSEPAHTASERRPKRFVAKVAAGALAVTAVGASIFGVTTDGTANQEAAIGSPVEDVVHAADVIEKPDAPIVAPASAVSEQITYDSNATPWSELAKRMPADQIAPTISQAMDKAKANGHDVQQNGVGKNLYYSVDGDSSAAAIMAYISQ